MMQHIFFFEGGQTNTMRGGAVGENNFLRTIHSEEGGGCNGGRALRLVCATGPINAARLGSDRNAVARPDLESCHMENYTFGKVPLGENPWEVAFGNVH